MHVCVCVCVSVCVCAHVLNHVWLFATIWTIAHQAPLSMKFSRQEFLSGLSFPTPRDLPNPGIEPASLVSPALVDRFFTTESYQKFILILPHLPESQNCQMMI